ncbi:MAG: Tol-Pal system beta propeller repeat protein TolB [Gammaproteobacteria bacterium]|uniref:Tol-Pal system beta propeller repeat protein TolB n=1 Tax=SAR86 cluster bacterium TaxID=2030880 RepID=A0A520MT93_9GAMM|nr:MAG: Tol-Pal system beta propeller repeat protein TolB [SAR86 cluster bacterium]|tara:strand:- start:847 stop:2100 length:1254 start_codon:yes stop_codon:yes gene_type:complete
MKKILALIVFSLNFHADLVLEITESASKPIKIAILEKNNNSLLGQEIIKIISNDLSRTGEFKVIANDELLSIPTNENEVIQRDWLLLDVDSIVFVDVQSQDNDLDISYSIFNISYNETEDKRRVLGLPDSLRQSSHYVSDGIYEFFYGIEGISSTKLMYVTKTANIHRLIISDSDGFNEQVLLKSNSAIISPAWSSDAQQIAYVSFENNRAQVFTQNLVSGQRELIISSRSSVSSPAWSPNNEELAFASTKDGNSEIYVINLRNKNINRLTENIAIDTEPAWSPDGKKIIFTSDRSGSPQIYEIDIRTKLKRRLTTVGTYNARASYLSNKEIILVHRNLTNFNIASLNLNTRDLSVLTSTKNDESPCIAPNGNVIIYATKDGNLSYLAGVNISSKVSFKLPALYGELKEPAWSPFIR